MEPINDKLCIVHRNKKKKIFFIHFICIFISEIYFYNKCSISNYVNMLNVGIKLTDTVSANKDIAISAKII